MKICKSILLVFVANAVAKFDGFPRRHGARSLDGAFHQAYSPGHIDPSSRPPASDFQSQNSQPRPQYLETQKPAIATDNSAGHKAHTTPMLDSSFHRTFLRNSFPRPSAGSQVKSHHRQIEQVSQSGAEAYADAMQATEDAKHLPERTLLWMEHIAEDAKTRTDGAFQKAHASTFGNPSPISGVQKLSQPIAESDMNEMHDSIAHEKLRQENKEMRHAAEHSAAYDEAMSAKARASKSREEFNHVHSRKSVEAQRENLERAWKSSLSALEGGKATNSKKLNGVDPLIGAKIESGLGTLDPPTPATLGNSDSREVSLEAQRRNLEKLFQMPSAIVDQRRKLEKAFLQNQTSTRVHVEMDGLPQGWKAARDLETHAIYYWHVESKKATWHHPGTNEEKQVEEEDIPTATLAQGNTQRADSEPETPHQVSTDAASSEATGGSPKIAFTPSSATKQQVSAGAANSGTSLGIPHRAFASSFFSSFSEPEMKHEAAADAGSSGAIRSSGDSKHETKREDSTDAASNGSMRGSPNQGFAALFMDRQSETKQQVSAGAVNSEASRPTPHRAFAASCFPCFSQRGKEHEVAADAESGGATGGSVDSQPQAKNLVSAASSEVSTRSPAPSFFTRLFQPETKHDVSADAGNAGSDDAAGDRANSGSPHQSFVHSFFKRLFGTETNLLGSTDAASSGSSDAAGRTYQNGPHRAFSPSMFPRLSVRKPRSASFFLELCALASFLLAAVCLKPVRNFWKPTLAVQEPFLQCHSQEI